MSQFPVRLALISTAILLAASLIFVCRAADRPRDRSAWIWVRRVQPDCLRQYLPVQTVLDWLDPTHDVFDATFVW